MADRDWRDDFADAADAAGLKASRDEADSILMAEARYLLVPGSQLEALASALARDLTAKAPGPVTRATAAALVRAAANLRALALVGYDSQQILAVLSAAAARLEMQAKP